MGILGLFRPPRAGVLHQPLGGLPQGAGDPSQGPGDQGPPVSGSPGSGTSDPGIRGSGETPSPGAGEPSQASGAPEGGPALGVLHQPLAPGPRGSRGGAPGPRSSAGSPRGVPGASPEASFQPLPGRGSPGYRGGSPPPGGDPREPEAQSSPFGVRSSARRHGKETIRLQRGDHELKTKIEVYSQNIPLNHLTHPQGPGRPGVTPRRGVGRISRETPAGTAGPRREGLM